MIVLNETSTEALFLRITQYPKFILLITLLAIIGSASGLTQLVKDTSMQAFIPPGHASLLADDKARDIFGISDPIAIAVISTSQETVFTPATLQVIRELSEAVGNLPNVHPDRVASIATESSIRGKDGELLVDPYVLYGDITAEQAHASHQRWQAMEPHRGTLVSDDGRAAVIMADVIDHQLSADTYETVVAIIEEYEVPGLAFHIAGPSAVSGFLSESISNDARKMQPLVFALVLGFIFLAFRRLQAMPGPLLVVAGAAGGSLGIMAWCGIPYYAITNSLPVILVAISVADVIHILSAYYKHRSEDTSADSRTLVVAAMTEMARPITLTSLTTIAGFAGIAACSIMPPITWFAIFAGLGVALAWLFSIFGLPCLLVLMKLRESPAFSNWERHKPSGIGRFLGAIGRWSADHYGLVGLALLLITAVALTGATQTRFDRSIVDNFAADEPIRIADEQINRIFAGTAFLDVIVETEEPEGLLRVDYMEKIAALQAFFEQLPHVQKTVAITDYLGLLHRAIEEQPSQGVYRRTLPDSDDAISQYLLVYETSGDPTDFEEEIDYQYKTAFIRGAINTHYFSDNRPNVEALNAYIQNTFNEPGLTATLSGNVNIAYHWMSRLEATHFQGVAISLALVLLTASLVFRSIWDGIISVIPVSLTVLLLYAVMGYLGIYLEPATSMFAAIAIGVGVDFSIHLVDGLHASLKENGDDLQDTLTTALPPIARACFFNSTALALGFSVLMSSELPMLQRFGGLVTLAALASFLTALVIIPACFAARYAVKERKFDVASVAPSILLVMLAGATALNSDAVRAEDDEALRIASAVANRDEGSALQRRIKMTLTDRKGRNREREAQVLRQRGDGTEFTRITYLMPKSVRDVSYLSHSYTGEDKSDNRWLYLPASRKVRRVPASDRGDYFLGTDFTYEDVESELKFDLDDYNFVYAGQEIVDGEVHHLLNGEPRDEDIARQLGYGAIEARVAEKYWMPLEVHFYDLRKQPLKTVTVQGIESISGIWTATDITAVNHQTGHQTRFEYDNIVYTDSLPEQYFDSQTLSRGLPRSIEE